MTKKANLLIVDDQPSIREGLRSLLEEHPSINIVYEAGDERSFLHVISNHTIDIILLDIKLKDVSGLELLAKLKGIASRPRVVALTGLEGEEVIVNLLKAGVNGIVHKLDHYEHIVKAINSALNMESYFTQYVTRVIQANTDRLNDIPSVVFSKQEKEVLQALANGLTNIQMAEQFKMTEGSMEKFRSRLMNKAGAPNAFALLAFAYRNGIL